MAFTLLSFSFLGNIVGASSSDAPPEVASADSEWTLLVDGAVNQPLNLTLSDLAAMPRITVNSPLYCLGSLVVEGDWTGVKVEYLLDSAGLQDEAASLTFFASDGYLVQLDLTEAFHDNVILAYELDGHPLSESLRLVLPGKNGAQWIAWVTQITVSTVHVSTPASASYLPPPLSQPPSMPHSTDASQPAEPITVLPENPSPQADFSSMPQQEPQDLDLPKYDTFVILAVIVAVIAATVAFLYLKRKK